MFTKAGTSSDYLEYGRIQYIDTAHNRLSILAAESILAVMRRSNILTSRSVRLMRDFFIEKLAHFTILSENPILDILEMWSDAGSKSTGSEQEFMITVLVEIQSIFSAQSHGFSMSMEEYLSALYPQLHAKPIELPGEEAESFNLSYVFLEGRNANTVIKEILQPVYSWALPWMILAHADSLVLGMLLENMVNISEGASNGNSQDSGSA